MSLNLKKKPEIGKSGNTIKRRKTKVSKANLDGLFDPAGADNPLDNIDYTGDIADDTKAEEGEILKTLKEQEKADKRRFDVAVDTEYWCCLYFQSREQKEQFLIAMDWLKYGDKYLNGLKIAAEQGIELQEERLTTQGRTSQRLKSFVLGRK